MNGRLTAQRLLFDFFEVHQHLLLQQLSFRNMKEPVVRVALITVSESVSLFQRPRYRSGLPKCSYVIRVRYVHRLDKRHLVICSKSALTYCADALRSQIRTFERMKQMLFLQSVHITYINDITSFGESRAITESQKK